MICTQCGQPMPDGTKFCMECGGNLITGQTPAPPPSNYPAPMPPPQHLGAMEQLPYSNAMIPPQPGFHNPALTPRPNDMMANYNTMQASAGRNWLERIAAKIPGYKGYLEKETRRDVDKQHREHLATMLFQLKAPINNIVRELSENRRLFEVGPLERTLQKLDKLENRIRYASYGYAGFFDTVKIRENELDQLYHFDLALVEDVEKLQTVIAHLVASVSNAQALKSAAQELVTALDAMDTKFSQRYQAIENPTWSPY